MTAHSAHGLAALLLLAVGSFVHAGDVAGSAASGPPPAPAAWSAAETALIGAVEAYHAALTGDDLAAIERHVVNDDRFVMLEGRHSNFGWRDYRDHHLTQELDDLAKTRFRLTFYRVEIDGSLGYATFRYEVLPKTGPEMDFGTGFATAVLNRTADGWKLLHLHMS